MDILQAAKQVTGVDWNMRGGVLEQSQDANPRVAMPDMAVLQAMVDKEAYKEQRAKEYPPVGDQLDALWFGGKTKDDMLAQIQAVKAKYPKS